MQKVEPGPESKKKFRPWLNFSNPAPTVTPSISRSTATLSSTIKSRDSLDVHPLLLHLHPHIYTPPKAVSRARLTRAHKQF